MAYIKLSLIQLGSIFPNFCRPSLHKTLKLSPWIKFASVYFFLSGNAIEFFLLEPTCLGPKVFEDFKGIVWGLALYFEL